MVQPADGGDLAVQTRTESLLLRLQPLDLLPASPHLLAVSAVLVLPPLLQSLEPPPPKVRYVLRPVAFEQLYLFDFCLVYLVLQKQLVLNLGVALLGYVLYRRVQVALRRLYCLRVHGNIVVAAQLQLPVQLLLPLSLNSPPLLQLDVLQPQLFFQQMFFMPILGLLLQVGYVLLLKLLLVVQFRYSAGQFAFVALYCIQFLVKHLRPNPQASALIMQQFINLLGNRSESPVTKNNFVKLGPCCQLGPNYCCFATGFAIVTGVCLFYLVIMSSVLSPKGINLAAIAMSNMLFSYLNVALSDPGIAPQPQQDVYNLAGCQPVCDECGGLKRRGTAHCFQCGVCVEGYDHHCPWVGKCIGARNIVKFYYFVASLFFGVVGLAVVAIIYSS